MTSTVLFDLDDTLFDHRHGTREALRALRAASPPLQRWADEDLHARHAVLLEALHLDVLAGRLSVDEARTQRFARLFSDAGERLSSSQAADVAARYRAAYVAAWRLVPGALTLVSALHATCRVGVVTNNVVSEQQQKIRALGLGPYVDALVISEAVGVTKPDPRIFAIALERLEAAAPEAVMVGDSWATDIAGARAAGIRAVWYNPENRPMPEQAAVVSLMALEPTDKALAIVVGTDS